MVTLLEKLPTIEVMFQLIFVIGNIPKYFKKTWFKNNLGIIFFKLNLKCHLIITFQNNIRLTKGIWVPVTFPDSMTF